jgi:hypothetical protein
VFLLLALGAPATYALSLTRFLAYADVWRVKQACRRQTSLASPRRRTVTSGLATPRGLVRFDGVALC